MKIFIRTFMFLMVCTLFSGITWATEKTKTSYSDLDQALQYRISSDMGRENPAYHFVKERSDYTSSSFSAGIKAIVNQTGVTFLSGVHSWSLSLRAFGASEVSMPQKGLLESSKIDGNRLEFTNGPEMMSWYINGPGGFQQGWTINSRQSDNAEPLSLSMDFSGDLNPTLMEGRCGIILNDYNGTAVFNYQGLIAFDAANKQLPVWFEKHGQTIAIKVDDSNAQYPVVIDPWVQAAKMTASDPVTLDYLGFSVAISSDGSTVVSGAYLADPGTISASGAAYVYVKPVGGWIDATQVAKLSASDKAANDWLGTNVSISSDGSIIAVTAYGSDPGGTTGAGALYVFVKPVGGWVTATQTAKLTTSDKAASDALGWSIAMTPDGSTIVGGATSADHRTSVAGALYVFLKPTEGWISGTEAAKLIAAVQDPADKLGYSSSISSNGSTIVSGAYAANPGGTATAGAVYVFEKPGGGWTGTAVTPITQIAKLTASDKVAADNLGFSVAISADGSTIAAGSYKADFSVPTAMADAGATYVYVKPGGGWADATQTVKLTASDQAASDWFGYSEAISSDGSLIITGSYKSDFSGVADAGAVYVFTKPVGGWASVTTETSKLSASDKVASDYFGKCVAMVPDGSTLVIGAPFADPGSISGCGAFYIFGPVPTVIPDTKVSGYTVYPNPASDIVNIRGLEDQLTDVKIYNVVGRIVADRKMIGGQVNVQDLTPGLYYIKIGASIIKIAKK
ncbi:MAG: T9SS type A sorting domain-containing protein [Bacteroidia bacterium]|nr:T9SS type A sorting domain-containing protein [Bacteroidia bacterium]